MEGASARIEFLGPVPELQVLLPPATDPSPFWTALAQQDVVASGDYAVSTDLRVLLHARLMDRHGKPLSPQRARELLLWFRDWSKRGAIRDGEAAERRLPLAQRAGRRSWGSYPSTLMVALSSP